MKNVDELKSSYEHSPLQKDNCHLLYSQGKDIWGEHQYGSDVNIDEVYD